MEERIQVAETALHERKREFDLNHGGTPEENQAIEDALKGLNVLRQEIRDRNVRVRRVFPRNTCK